MIFHLRCSRVWIEIDKKVATKKARFCIVAVNSSLAGCLQMQGRRQFDSCFGRDDMFWRKKAANEPLPWYRAKNYKGKMTEKQKRLLDTIRFQRSHPAATYEGLLPEVQNYINRLELEVYDAKQQSLFAGCALLSFLGGQSLYRDYTSGDEASLLSISYGVIMLGAPWIYYSVKFKKNASEHMPDENPTYPTDEALRVEWEIEHLSQMGQRERGE
jgi:hypothetical protein